MGPNSFIFTCIFSKKHPSSRSVPQRSQRSREFLDPPLLLVIRRRYWNLTRKLKGSWHSFQHESNINEMKIVMYLSDIKSYICLMAIYTHPVATYICPVAIYIHPVATYICLVAIYIHLVAIYIHPVAMTRWNSFTTV